MRYKAFISYSHAADGHFAPALQSALHKFAKPYYKLRALQVFRDQTDLSANPSLWPVIQKALDESEYFLLLASPKAAQSKWVRRELDYWLSIHKGAVTNLIIILTEGNLSWDSEAGDFDWDITDALPSDLDWDGKATAPHSLKKRFTDEPLYIDQRWVRTEKDLSLRNPRFLDQLATVASTLHGRPKSEMIGEDVTEHKRYRRARTIVGLLLLIFAVVAGVFAVYANMQKNTAEAQRKTALSRQLAAQSLNYMPDQVDLALLLSVEARNTADTLEARSSLLSSLEYSADIGTFLHGSGARVESIAFSPDGKLLASGGHDNTIVLWDIDTHQRAGQPLNGHTDWVYSVAFSPDGRFLASGGKDRRIILWDVTTMRQDGNPLVAHSDFVWSVAFSPSGHLLASGSADGTIILWDIQGRQQHGNALTKHDGAVFEVAFSPDGKTLASGGVDGAVILWDIATRKPLVLSTADTPIQGVAFGPDGKTLAVSDDRETRLWDVTTRRPIGEPFPEYGANIQSMSFSADGRLLASGYEDGTVILWDADTRRKLSQPLTGLTRPIDAVAFRPGDKGTTLGWAGDDKKIGLWDVSTLHRFMMVNPTAASRDIPLVGGFHTVPAASVNWNVALSPDGKILAASDTHKPDVTTWDLVSRQQIGKPLPVGTFVKFVTFSPDSRTLAARENGVVSLWDVSRLTGNDVSPIRITALVNSMAFSPDSKILVLGTSEGIIKFIEVATGRQVGEPIKAHIEPVFSLALSPDGKTLASGSRDKTIKLWDVDTHQPLYTPLSRHTGAVYALAFTPDGTFLTSGGTDNVVVLWDVTKWTALRQFIGHTETIWQVAFSPDSRTLASISGDGTCSLWDVTSGQQQVRLQTGTTKATTSIAFSADGKTLVTGHDAIISWDVSYDNWMNRACQIANRNLSPAEWSQHFGDEPYHKTCQHLP